MPDTKNRRRWTIYCMKHEALERVEDVTEVHPFRVYEGDKATGRTGTEVRAITDAGCKAHFMGGAQWNQ